MLPADDTTLLEYYSRNVWDNLNDEIEAWLHHLEAEAKAKDTIAINSEANDTI